MDLAIKTGKRWHEEYKKETNMQVCDPDGWRNDGLDFDTYMCSWAEFKERALHSTLIPAEHNDVKE